MVKKFTIPFASQGDANDIPDALQVDGKVSFTQGFGYDYERPYDDPQAKDIAREDMNGLFKAITSAVGELQTLGASEWSNAISYPKGAIVYYEKDLYISQVDDNQNKPPQSWVSITSIANDSLKKAANLSDLTNKATARNNLGLGNSATLNKTDVLGTSTSLVATQKLVNDTKINLENSKQDKLTFSGTGNVARMSEVDKKRDKTDGIFDRNLLYLRGASGTSDVGFLMARGGINKGSILVNNTTDTIQLHRYSDSGGLVSTASVPKKSGTLALTSDIPTVSQSTGSSTTNVMSQKAVTDQLNAIKSDHGLGYGQEWVNVTGNRAKDVTYKNNTGKPIQLNITVNYSTGIDYRFELVVDGLELGGISSGMTLIIPENSTYKAILGGNAVIRGWSELR